MAWNEPGGNNRDPWGGNNQDKGPPDLDEIVRKLSDKFGGLFGGKQNGSGGDGSGGGSSGGGNISNPLSGAGSFGFMVIAAIIGMIWLASGIYTVDQGTRGIELRFGEYSATTGAGLSYHFPYPFESVEIVDVEQRRAKEIGYRSSGQQTARPVPREALMLTEDENIVDIRLSVQYQIDDPKDYLFSVVDPDETLVQVVESVNREVIGKSTMDFVLTEGRSAVVAEVKELSQKILDEYETGLLITNVNLQDAQPPEQVQAAFADAIKAREDEQRLINEAEAYRNQILPTARGQGARRLEEASAYKDQVIARAEGETQRFTQLLKEYQKAPAITRDRLYIETMESVLSATSKVLIDVEGGNNLIYLPLDRLMNKSASSGPSAARDRVGGSSLLGQAPSSSDSGSRLRDNSRDRGVRQ